MKDTMPNALWIVSGHVFNVAGLVGSFAANSAWVLTGTLLITSLILAIAAVDKEGQS
ncbi:hypothetical protein KDW55_02215 [Burkholderia sp. AU19243]|uniref:hypothetical protein n=1 Tax=Burkholderia sp. AU19243 TaxID=2824810 RepID=UPI001B9DE072|nr:hypothetical protein [Burkholderia sp. AU19243]MBR8362132.1 hypothetical protein [Burkholderia sp. AU19243]